MKGQKVRVDLGMSNRYFWVGIGGAWRPAWMPLCDHRYRSMEPCAPSARGKEMTPLVDGNQFHKFLRNVGFYLPAVNLPIVQFELISRHMDTLRP